MSYVDNLAYAPTTGRHNIIIGSLIGEIHDLHKRKQVFVRSEQYSIVYWGSRRKPSLGASLVKVEEVEDIEEFRNNIIYELDFVQPDFVVFKDNKYITDDRDLRTAGQPDLIAEVWSRNNSEADKKFLRDLYATSDITEFWQVEQDSNIVKCSVGGLELAEQSLADVLRARNGLEFDLRYLAK